MKQETLLEVIERTITEWEKRRGITALPEFSSKSKSKKRKQSHQEQKKAS